MPDVSLGTATGKITIDASGAQSGASQFQLALTSLNQVITTNWWGLQAIGNVLGSIGGLGVAAFTQAADAAATWDTEMAQLNTTLYGASSGTELAAGSIAEVSNQLLNLGNTIPVSIDQLGNIANEVAKVGVAAPDVAAVTATIANLGQTTGESTADMIESFGRFSATLGLTGDAIQRAGSSIFDLSRETPATAENIAIVTDRIDGLRESANVTTPDLLGIASAVATIAPNARTAASTINQTFQAIGEAVDTGGVKLEDFADLANMSQQQFVQAWQSGDTTGIFTKIVQGLGAYSQASGQLDAVLKNLGLSSASNTQILGGLSEAQDQTANSNAKLSTQVALSNDAWTKGTDLQKAAQTQYQQFQAQLKILENTIQEVYIAFGNQFLPILKDALTPLSDFATGMENLTPSTKDAILIITALGTAVSLGAAAFFRIFPIFIQAANGFQSLVAGVTAYTNAANAGTDVSSRFTEALVEQEQAAESATASNAELTQSTLDQEIALAKLNVTEEAANAKNLAASIAADSLTTANQRLSASNLEVQAATDAVAEAEAALIARQEELAGLTRNQLVSQAAASGVENSTSLTAAGATAALTQEQTDALAASQARLETATMAVSNAENIQATSQQKAATTAAQAELAELQLQKAKEADTLATQANTDAIAANSIEQEVFQGQITKSIADIAELRASAATPINVEENLVTNQDTSTTTTGSGVEDTTATSQSASAANEQLLASYANLAEVVSTYNAELSTQVAAQERAEAATLAEREAVATLTASLEAGGVESEAYAAALQSAVEAGEELTASNLELAAANAVLAASEEAVTAATAELDASLAVGIAEEDAASFGLASIGQAAGLAAGAAVIAATGFTALAGAHEKDAQAAKDAAGPNMELVGILQETGQQLTADTDKWIENAIVKANAIPEIEALGFSLAQVVTILNGTASDALLQRFTEDADAAGNKGEKLLQVVQGLAQTMSVAEAQASKLNGANEALGIQSDLTSGDINDLNNSLGATPADASKAATALENLATAEEDVQKAQISVINATTALNTALEKQSEQGEDVQKAYIAYEKSLLDIQTAQETLANDTVALNNAQQTQADETATAVQGLADAQNKYKDSVQTVTEDQEKLNEALNPQTAIDSYNDALSKVANAQLSLQSSTTAVAQAQFNLNYLMDEHASNADILNAQQELSAAQQKQVDDTNAVNDANSSLATNQQDSQNAIIDAQNTLNDAIASQVDDLDAVTKAQETLAQAQEDAANNKDYNDALSKVAQDTLALQSAQVTATDSARSLNDAWQEGPALAAAVQTAQLGLVDAYVSQAVAMTKVQQDLVEMAGGTWTAAMDAQALLNNLSAIAPTVTGVVKPAFDNFVSTIQSGIGGISSGVSTLGGTGSGGVGSLPGSTAAAATGVNTALGTINTAINTQNIPTLQGLEHEHDNLVGKLGTTQETMMIFGGRAGGVAVTTQAYLDLQNQIKQNEAEQDTYRGNLSTLSGAFDTSKGHIETVANALNIDLSHALTRPEIQQLEGGLQGLQSTTDATGGHFGSLNTNIGSVFSQLGYTVGVGTYSIGLSIGGMVTAVNNAATGVDSQTYYNKGRDITVGLHNGIVDAENDPNISPANAVAGMSQDLLNALHQSMQFGSPSKVMYQLGAYITQGLTQGIISEKSDLFSAVTDVAGGVVNAALLASQNGVNSLNLTGSSATAAALLGGTNTPNTTTTDLETASSADVVSDLKTQLDSLTDSLARLTSTSEQAAASQLTASGSEPTGDTYHFHEVQTSAAEIMREASWSKRVNARN